MPIKDRFGVVARWLELLVEHVGALSTSAEKLRGDRTSRPAAILDAFAAEEAAKILILLDLARLGWRDQSTASRQLSYFSSHLARGIYVEVTTISPGSFGELRRFVESLRPSRYLDGPNDVDWIFRNRIETIREETLYVDYVKDEEGFRWVSPRDQGAISRWRYQIVDTVLAMDRLGLLSLRGLELTADVWKDAKVDDTMSWPDNSSRNLHVLQALWELSAAKVDATDDDASLVLDRWTFPMGTLDLSRIEVTNEELARERAKGEARIVADWYGDVGDNY